MIVYTLKSKLFFLTFKFCDFRHQKLIKTSKLRLAQMCVQIILQLDIAQRNVTIRLYI